MLVEEIFLKYSQAELLINARYSPYQIKHRGFLPRSKEKLNKKPFFSNLSKHIFKSILMMFLCQNFPFFFRALWPAKDHHQ